MLIKCFERLIKALIYSSLPDSLDPLQFDYPPNRITDNYHNLHFTHSHLGTGKGNSARLLWGWAPQFAFWVSWESFSALLPLHLWPHSRTHLQHHYEIHRGHRGLISNNNEPAYMDKVEMLSSSCKENNLDLNVPRTKEMVVDFMREKQRIHCTPLRVYRTLVKKVCNYKYLVPYCSSEPCLSPCLFPCIYLKPHFHSLFKVFFPSLPFCETGLNPECDW